MTAVLAHITLGTTIDEVIAGLDGVIESSVQQNSRLAYFACLYRAVTAKVREGIAVGRFEDGQRMERLDVVFANRYLAALQAYGQGARLSRSWEVAFGAARSWHLLVLQHLLLGIHAHINFDLGIAAAQTAPGAALAGLKHDFDEISAILGEMLDDVQSRIARISPWMGLFDRLAGRSDEALFSFSASTARDLAWRTAQRLARLHEEAQATELDQLDRTVAALAQPIRSPGRWITTLLLIIRAREPNRVGDVVQALRSDAKGGG